MEAATIRNALGDIGNRIGLGINSNKNEATNQLLKQQSIIQPNVKQHVTTEIVVSTTTTNTSATNSLITSDESSQDVEILESSVDEDEAILDIDSGDADNPQLFSEYVRDIYAYLVQLERKYRISPHFLQSKTVTAKMRAILIDWLIQVHAKFRLLQETMYLCVYLLDAYLERQDVSKGQLQLVGVTALLLACKYEEMYVPAIEDFVYMTDSTYASAEIRSMEVHMCKTLDFAFGKPLPLHFLRRFSKAGQADPKQHTLAKYFMDLSLHDSEFASFDPSYLAASSLCLSFKLLEGPQWNKNMEHYSGYKRSSLLLGMQKIAKLLLRCNEPDYKYKAADYKYKSSIRLSSIANDHIIRDLAVATSQ